MKDVIVIDNCIPKDLQDKIENLMTRETFVWNFVPSASYGSMKGDPSCIGQWTENVEGAVDTLLFTHFILNQEGNWSSVFPTITPILTALPYTVAKLIRIKANLTVYDPNMGPNNFGVPHIDIPGAKTAITAIYYVNDSDGDTVIFNEKWNNGLEQKLTIKERVPPKKGRLVAFNNELIHAGNNPSTTTPRLTMNINYFPHIPGTTF